MPATPAAHTDTDTPAVDPVTLRATVDTDGAVQPTGCDGDVWTLSYGVGLVALAVVVDHVRTRWTALAEAHGADTATGASAATTATDVILDPKTRTAVEAVEAALQAVANGRALDEAVFGMAKGLAGKGLWRPVDGTEDGPNVLSVLLDNAPESIRDIAARLFPDGVDLGEGPVSALELADTFITVAKHKGVLSPEYADAVDGDE